MPYANQAIETLLWSSIVGDDEHADQFEYSTGLANHVDELFQMFEEIVAKEMPNFDPEKGSPLTRGQISNLVEYLITRFPASPSAEDKRD